MDLGIAGKRALVCAASKGLGRGCAQALADAGCDVTIVARTAQDVSARRARSASAPAGRSRWVACDITTAEGRAAALAACPQPDILVNNAGGPPPGDFRDWTRDDWIRALDANMLTPIELIKSTIDGMIARRFGRIVNITSSAVKAPIDILGLSQRRTQRASPASSPGSRATSRATTSRSTTCCPGSFDTDRLRSMTSNCARRRRAYRRGVRAQQLATHPAGRFGTADEFGAACAFLCSAHAGYIVGQNILHRRRPVPRHVLTPVHVSDPCT